MLAPGPPAARADGTYAGWVTSLAQATDNWNQNLDVVNPGIVTIP